MTQDIPRKKRPRDPARLAKFVIDVATGEIEDREPWPPWGLEGWQSWG